MQSSYETIAVLIVTRDTEAGEKMRELLEFEPGFEVEVATHFQSATSLNDPVDVAVAIVGPDRVEWLEERVSAELNVPVIACLLKDDMDCARELLLAGIQECLPFHDCDSKRIALSVRRALWTHRGQSKRIEQLSEKKLRDAEAPYLSLVETLTQNIVRKDIEGRFTFANSNFCKALGRPSSEILGKKDSDFFSASLAKKYQEDDRRVIESRVPFQVEEAHKIEDGQTIIVNVVKTPVFDSSGRVTGTQSIFWDITDQKRAQSDLAASKERFELAVRGTSDGIWDWDILTNDVYFSDRFKELLGFNPNEFGSTFAEWESRLHPEDHDLALESIQAHLENRVPYDVDYRLRRKDGDFSWFRARGMAIWTASGKATRMAGSISDISDRKQAEEALRARTEELEKSNHDLEQFAYIASHDLKEPLRMVSSYVGLLNRRYGDTFDEDGKEFINYAVEGSKRMKTLIEDLLVFSRVGTKGKELIATESSEAIAAAISNLDTTIRETDTRIEFDENSLPVIEGDIVQLIQLFQNLISNAIKFNEQSQPLIKIEAKPCEDKKYWSFTVEDNGIGIDSAHSDRIFEVFQRLHTRTAYEGTGIGLAVARKIVERHGGNISVSSTKGSGSTFSFTLHAADTKKPEQGLG